jgi:cell division protein FtsW
VAERLGYDTFHFVSNQLLFMVLAVAVLFGASFLNITWVRRLSLLGYICGCLLMVAALNFGPEIKGAHRWINLGPFNLQPSELVKPTFTLMAAWLLAERVRRPDIPGNWFAWALYACFVTLLMLEPDFGQTLLITAVFGTMLIVSGISWKFTLCLIGGVMSGAVTAYHSLPHVASRIDRFLSPDKGDTFQVDTALQAFKNGGLMGTGPGGGEAKLVLPDAHTDFTFAVVGEEFGLIACLLLMSLFAFVVLKILVRAKQEPDPFVALALSGLGLIFGFQAIINMGVNTALLPAKGMTLPFISYGGSSLMGMAFGMGMVLALGRKRFGVRSSVPELNVSYA